MLNQKKKKKEKKNKKEKSEGKPRVEAAIKKEIKEEKEKIIIHTCLFADADIILLCNHIINEIIEILINNKMNSWPRRCLCGKTVSAIRIVSIIKVGAAGRVIAAGYTIAIHSDTAIGERRMEENKWHSNLQM